MAGIYLHIPFCKQACHYCNFHFSTSLKYKTDLIETLVKEIHLQKDFLHGATIETIYFGGGTPSLLDVDELNILLNTIYQLHKVRSDSEITLEANPDDLTISKIKQLQQSAINRLSIGIQSFSEEDLHFMNRAHTAKESKECLEHVLAAGFSNLTIDLIYGSPTTSKEQWQENLMQFFQYDIPHLSCYCLTVEPQTALDHFVKTGKAAPVDEEIAAQQFEYLVQELEKRDYEQYEISNFSKPNWHARHNTNYWKGVPYLGIGPSAHSFDGKNRQWNIANNAKYIQSIRTNKIPFEQEILSPEERYNEYIMTGLRTKWGVSLQKIESDFQHHFQEKIQVFLQDGSVRQAQQNYTLTTKGKLLADRIAMELFV